MTWCFFGIWDLGRHKNRHLANQSMPILRKRDGTCFHCEVVLDNNSVMTTLSVRTITCRRTYDPEVVSAEWVQRVGGGRPSITFIGDTGWTAGFRR